MKKFLLNIFAVAVPAIVILVAISWYCITSLKRSDFRLSEDTHTIVIGPSTTGCAMNEKYLNRFENLSRDGTALDFTVPLLPRILKENPQIDTVLINHGRFQFRYQKNISVKHHSSQWIRHHLPFIFYDTEPSRLKDYFLSSNFYCAILNPELLLVLSNRSKMKNFDIGFTEITRDNLNNRDAQWSIAWYDSLKREHGGNDYSKEYLREHYSSADYWARKAIEICKQNNVVPVLFFTPLYQYDRWFTMKSFCDFIRDYEENTLISDYEDFKFPDDTYYGDVHHLNKKGSIYFTSHIANNGLKTQTLKEWLKEKDNE